MLEKDIEKKLVAGVKKLNGRAFKWVSPGTAGVPDRIVILPQGRIYFVELKTESGYLRPLQKIQIGLLQGLGCQVRVLRGIEDVNSFLEEVGS